MEFYNYVRFNTFYFIIGMAVIALPIDISIDTKQFFLVTLYHIAFLIYAFRLHLDKWINIFSFLFPLSLFLFFPDWIFSSIIKVLVYVPTDLLKVGNIPVYIAGMWVIPLFLIVYAAELIYKRYNKVWVRDIFLLLSSCLIFNYFEEITWELPVWYYHKVQMFSHIAAYAIIPNILIGIYTYYGYKLVAKQPLPVKIIGAFIVMLVQLGTLMLSYFFIDIS